MPSVRRASGRPGRDATPSVAEVGEGDGDAEKARADVRGVRAEVTDGLIPFEICYTLARRQSADVAGARHVDRTCGVAF